MGSSSLITNLDGEIVQYIEYVPFGEVFIEERNSTWNTPYLFNAKELDEETGLYYYGARYYDPRISRFLSVDRFAEFYPSLSAYSYCANNPIKYIDVRGDSLDISHFRNNNPRANNILMPDLHDKTGLTLNTDDAGNVTYSKVNGKPLISLDENGKQIGSKSARNKLIKLIDSKTKVSVRDYPHGGSRVMMDGDEPNVIWLDSYQIDDFIKNTSADLNPTTYGYAMNFFHELGHTGFGGRKLDSSSPQLSAGEVEDFVNKIRREMGKSYGQRVVYSQFLVRSLNKTYMAFSKEAYKTLLKGLMPKGQYILMEDFTKK